MTETQIVRWPSVSLLPAIINRFWSKVEKSEGCWIWTSGKFDDGYGKFTIKGVKTWRAHRLAWFIEFGVISENLCVLHKCDNPPCCRPSHLFTGTNLENTQDASSKGRLSHGDSHWTHKSPELVLKRANHPLAKFSEGDISEIRRKINCREISQANLARQLGVWRSTIWAIVHHVRWP